MSGKLKIPFREINVNTLPIARPSGGTFGTFNVKPAVPAVCSTLIRPVPPIKNCENEPDIIFLGDGNVSSNRNRNITPMAREPKKSRHLASKSQNVNVADLDLTKARKTITDVVDSPFLDMNSLSKKTKVSITCSTDSTVKGGKSSEKSDDVSESVSVPFREINVNTFPIAGPSGGTYGTFNAKPAVPAVRSTLIRPVPPIKNCENEPHIIFLGDGNVSSNQNGNITPMAREPKKSLHLASKSQNVNVADLDLTKARKIITDVVDSPFLDMNSLSKKTKVSITCSTDSTVKGGKGSEKSDDVSESVSVIDQKLVIATQVQSGSSQREPICIYEDEVSDLSEDFEQPSKKNKKKRLSKRRSQKVIATQSDCFSSSTSEVSEVMKILPEGYDYKIQMHPSPAFESSKCKNFSASVKVNIFSAQQAEKWKTDFEKSSFSDYRVMKSFSELKNSQRVIFKKKYRCHHNTLAEKSKSKVPHEKHINCPAELTITVRNPEMQWSSDDLLKTHPAQILIKYLHNHYIDPLAGDILRHRRPAPEVVEKFTNLFTNTKVYHSPASAMDVYLADLELDPLYMQVGDGAVVPTMAWVHKLSGKLTRHKCGDQYGEGMLEALKKYVDEYNDDCGDICAKVGVTADAQNHFVAICSPMMKRIHTHHKASGEVMFIDSSGSMDSNNARVFVMLTPSVAGGLPIGLLITFSEKEEVVTAALQSWKEILPKNAFYGRGPEQGPKIIISDDSFSERNSLKNHFPGAVLLLCIFHVLQAMWRYLWNSEHGVKFEHRVEIYFMFRQILYATTEDEFNTLYDDALASDLLQSYKIVWDHFKGLRSRASEWALCFRQQLLLRGHNTNNYCEAAMRILKDKIFDRVRAFNTVQLLDFLLTRLDAYYSRKLAFLVNNRVEGFTRTRYRIKPEKLVPLIATKLSDFDHLYKVVNTEKNTEYIVDADLEVCSCPLGMCGTPCKHQCIVAKTFKLSHHQFLPTSDSTIKAIFFYIMTGKTEVPAGLFKLLKGDHDTEDIIDVNNNPEFQLRNNECDEQPTASEEFAMEETEQLITESVSSNTDGENDLPQESPMKKRLMDMVMDLAQRCDDSPECMSEPVEKFLKTYWSIVKSKNHQSTLGSSLAQFGKDLSALKPLKHRRSKNIAVQPTALARRKVFCGGRRTQVGGRPLSVTSHAAADHGYSQVVKRRTSTTAGNNGESWAQPPVKKVKVPHSLSKCVDARVRLPK